MGVGGVVRQLVGQNKLLANMPVAFERQLKLSCSGWRSTGWDSCCDQIRPKANDLYQRRQGDELAKLAMVGDVRARQGKRESGE
jgi:hypothetical protein